MKSGTPEGVFQVVYLCGVDQTGAGTLIPGKLREFADEGGAGAGPQGENAVVFQQHEGFSGAFARKGVVGIEVGLLRRVGDRLRGGEEHGNQFPQALVQVGFGELAVLYGLHQRDGGISAGAGHGQVGTVLDAQGMVIVGTPVGDREAVEAPLLPEDLFQEQFILVGISAVYKIVAGHNRLGMALGDGDFKARQVDFPQRPLVHHGVGGHPPQFLGVGGEMLGAGGNTVFLNAPDVGRGHFARQVGVFGEILKIAAAQGAALHVQAGA